MKIFKLFLKLIGKQLKNEEKKIEEKLMAETADPKPPKYLKPILLIVLGAILYLAFKAIF